ncbi:bactofilin family protein [Pelagerythrobacter marensis]|uniref:Cell shape determination protein CcmA n=1 Tax=Pelagerythrobacter marensis TaxID=543877 RepID=A0A0G3XCE0_9SPHN|nr:polymer-forming cytoskeletal protein [Pelagerythrobacter marensis]AKM08264.1 Cell shape determination protein CcmA [Pelagerythrobacter marensis]
MARPSSPSGSTFSVIGADVTIKGDVTASTELHVDGRIEGDVTCDSLVQGESSVIEGAVSAEIARLAGQVRGSITARQLVVLKSARIEGDVHYDALTIEQGAQVEGRFAYRLSEGQTGDRNASSAATQADDGEPKLTLAQ